MFSNEIVHMNVRHPNKLMSVSLIVALIEYIIRDSLTWEVDVVRKSIIEWIFVAELRLSKSMRFKCDKPCKCKFLY